MTKYQYTGQFSYEAEFGLYFYNARWYDSQLGRFAQADTLIPSPGNPQAWDRFAYTLNNPLKFSDPSGHDVCDENGDCFNAQDWYRAKNAPKLIDINTLKRAIRHKFGITLVDDKFKWSLANVQTAYKALNMINNKLNGHLKKLVGGTTFTMTDGGDKYYGITDSTGVVFHTADSNTKIPLTNFLHEVGHLIDAVPATRDVFSGSLPDDPTWIKDGYVNSELLLGKLSEPVQAKPLGESYNRNEYWADAFANYVAGNINLEHSSGAGMAMATDVANALNAYLNP